jgi:hypothetical protein
MFNWRGTLAILNKGHITCEQRKIFVIEDW